MANYTVVRAAHKTLTSTTVDKVTLTGRANLIEVLNRAGSSALYVTTDGSVPTAGGDDCSFVDAGTALQIRPQARIANTVVVQIIGNGNDYSVEAVEE